MKKIVLLMCLLLSVFMLGGCGGSDKQASDDVKQDQIVLEYPAALQELGFKTPLVLDKIPGRVVSLAHTPVLALHEMGVQQIGIPKNPMFSWPETLSANAKEFNVIMNDNFDIESVVALEPDLVIVGYQAKDTYGKILEKEHIPVYYVDAGHVVSYQSVKELTEKLIKAFGRDNDGAKAIQERFAKLEERMAQKRAENKGKKVMVLQSAPPRHFIQTKDGTLGNMAELLGYENVYQNDKNKLVLLDREQALAYEPDMLLCVGGAMKAEEHQKVMEEDFAKNPEYWNNIKAVREGSVVYLPAQYIASAGINIIDNINHLMDILETKKL